MKISDLVKSLEYRGSIPSAAIEEIKKISRQNEEACAQAGYEELREALRRGGQKTNVADPKPTSKDNLLKLISDLRVTLIMLPQSDASKSVIDQLSQLEEFVEKSM